MKLEHKKTTYYIEEEVSINRLGEVAIVRFYLKRRATLFGIKLPFWKYVTIKVYGIDGYFTTKMVFYNIKSAKEYFDKSICDVVTKAHKKAKIVEILKC